MNVFGNTMKGIGTVFTDPVHDADNRKSQTPRFDAASGVANKSAVISYAV